MLMRSQDAWDAVRRGHRRQAVLQLWTPTGYVGDLPIEAGQLTVSLSTAAHRSGSVTVAGYSWWEYVRADSYSWVDAFATIDGTETFHLGEWPIADATLNRPGGSIELSLGDWSDRRSRALAETAGAIPAGQSLATMFGAGMSEVLPWPFAVQRDDTLGATVASEIRLQLGGDVWAAMNQAANARGALLVVTGAGTGEIRVLNPYAPYFDDLDGTVVRESSGESLDDAVNRIVVTVEPEAGDGTTYRAVQTLSSGAYAYSATGAGIGQCVLVDTKRVKTPSQAVADAEAKRLADRRFGIVRTLDLQVIPQPWLQASDVVAVTPSTGTGPEYWMVETISYPLTAEGLMRLTARSVTA